MIDEHDGAPTLRVEARFRNARLYEAIEQDRVRLPTRSAAGAAAHERGPIRSWCQFHGLNWTQVYELINLRKAPWALHASKDGTYARDLVYRKIAKDVAAALGVDLAWLFPVDLYRVKWPRLATSIDHRRFVPLLGQPERVLALPPTQDQGLELEDLRGVIAGALGCLTRREERIVRARYGLADDGIERSLDDLAKSEGVSRARVGAIEQHALAKLRRKRVVQEYRP